jgi:predicted NBD/HSP70 family sugar kinase
LVAHPLGPLVVIVDLRAAGWRVLLGDLVGEMSEVRAGTYDDLDPGGFLPVIAESVALAVRRSRGRARVVVATVAGTVTDTRLLQFSSRGWREADLAVLTSRLPSRPAVRLLAGNDATLGGLAEASTGAARTAEVALHVLVAVGVGGRGGPRTTGTGGRSSSPPRPWGRASPDSSTCTTRTSSPSPASRPGSGQQLRMPSLAGTGRG